MEGLARLRARAVHEQDTDEWAGRYMEQKDQFDAAVAKALR